ncbi:MAG: hypothetical protein Q8Q06_03295 [bacterium]|nr:hypothetical protein [bacterium]
MAPKVETIIKQKNILNRMRRMIHKPTQVEKDKRKGRGKERQKVKTNLRKDND